MMLILILQATSQQPLAPEPVYWELVKDLIVALVAGIVGAVLTQRFSVGESKRQRLRDLQRDFFAGSMLEPRLRAERMFITRKEEFQGLNLKQMFEGKLCMDQYKDVAVVLNVFRLLRAYKESHYIDEADARKQFGWAYAWWWENVFQPYTVRMEDERDWEPHIRKQEWLLKAQPGDDAV